MKIGILGTRGIPNSYGGFEQFAEHLAKGLVEKGFSVVVYNSSLHTYKQNEWNGVEIIHSYDPEGMIGTAGQFIYDFNCLRDAQKRNFDILLHLGYTSSSIWYKFWPKNALNIVNMDGLEWKRSKYNRLTQRFLKWAESLAVKKADILIADSKGIQNYINIRYKKSAHFIAYGAEIPLYYAKDRLTEFDLSPFEYYLVVARMEPENNIEMIIQGYLLSIKKYPLIIIGGTKNRFGEYLARRYASASIRFPGAIYDSELINSIRHFSALYFHGHSVGGTNPSLLEAMACECKIVANDNEFNRAILNQQASYFSNPDEVRNIIDEPTDEAISLTRRNINIEKIKKIYTWENINNDYEKVFQKAIEKRKQQSGRI